MEISKERPPPPCDERHIIKTAIQRTPAGDGKDRVERTVYFIDRRGEQDQVTDTWFERAA